MSKKKNEEKNKEIDSSVTNFSKSLLLITISLLLIGGLIVGGGAIIMNSYHDSQQKDLFLDAENYLDKAESDYYLKAELLYDDAKYYYETEQFNKVIEKCKEARDYFHDYSYEVRKSKAKLESYKKESKLIDLYIDLHEEDIKISENMYEACEYLESTSINYKQGDYEQGNLNLDKMNEKIRAHDDAVRRYNDIKAKLNNLFNEEYN